ncbi:hypothetical protein ACLVWQ_21590 [Streptomyces sp. CWNU-52B]|uniref:hypothetical protein n=1 Tax=unclassified Streptomyces TaxID=2593676 RepID=UPI0039C08740
MKENSRNNRSKREKGKKKKAAKAAKAARMKSVLTAGAPRAVTVAGGAWPCRVVGEHPW